MGNYKHIVISLTEARTIRDLFWNGFLERFLDAGVRISIFTEAVNYPPLVKEWSRDGIGFVRMLPVLATTGLQRRTRDIRHKLAKMKLQRPLDLFVRWEQNRVVAPQQYYVAWLRENKPDLVLSTHCHLFEEARLISSARSLGIPTLGVVKSWDNVYKGINTRPERIVVWNEVNKQELIDMEGYDPAAIKLVGPTQFDQYFRPENIRSREQFAERFKLDPSRPILMYASLGQFYITLDETVWMDLLMQALEAGQIAGNPQIICRLHPLSRLEFFQKYERHPDVRISYVDKYIPTLSWYMDKNDVIEMANMLYHSTAVITPGSTVSLEAAIFDKPTVMPIFHTYQPERAKRYFDSWVLGWHWKRIDALNLIKIIKEEAEYIPSINHALTDPNWYREGRKKLVEDYVHFTDGHSTDRLADLALKMIETGDWN